jgi:hypothetical protein
LGTSDYQVTHGSFDWSDQAKKASKRRRKDSVIELGADVDDSHSGRG